MQLNVSALKFGKMEAAVVASIAASILLWSFFLNAAGITVNDFFTFKLGIVLEKIISFRFLLFLLAFPATGAIITAFAKKMEKTGIMLWGTVSGFIALALAMALFPPLQGFWIIAVFYLIAIPLRVETAYIKYSELKNLVSLRTFMATAGRGAMVIGIGLFVLSAATIMADQEAYVEKFEETFMENVFQGFTSGKGQQQLASGAVDLAIENQKQALDAVLGNPLFEKLREKEDADVTAFVAAADIAREHLESPAYREQMEQQLVAGTEAASKSLDVMGLLKKQLPFIETVERFFWLLHGFILVSAFFLIANIVFKPLAAVYGLVIERLLGVFIKGNATARRE